MITTVKAPESRAGKKHTARTVTLASFDGFVPLQEGAANKARRDYYRRLLAYALESCLTAKQRDTVRRYYGEGRTLRALAAEEGVSPGTLSRRLARARRRLYRFTNQAALLEQMLAELRAALCVAYIR